MTIKTFSEELLKPAAKLCRQSMEFDVMPDFLLREKTFGEPDYEERLTLLAFEDDRETPVGFIMGVIKDRGTERVGYIKLLCVLPVYRRRGIASELYRQVEKVFIAEGIKKIKLFESYPNYFMPGIDPFYTEAICFFERLGFKRAGDTSNLTADLTVRDFDTSADEEKLKAEGYVLRRAVHEDKTRILDWISKNFAAWKYEVSEAFNNNPVTLFIAEKDGNILAFSAHEANNRGTGWFGPMGTDESLRGKGIGGVLFKKSLADMKSAGFVKAIIPWVGPIPFYMYYADSKVSRVFWRYEKIME